MLDKLLWILWKLYLSSLSVELNGVSSRHNVTVAAMTKESQWDEVTDDDETIEGPEAYQNPTNIKW